VSSHVFTTEALVIGSMRYREADRIVTLYTRDRGRLAALAKGVRRTKSKVGGRLEPFSLVRVSLYAGRGLYTVVGVDTLRTFQGVRDELFRLEEGARLFLAVRHLFPAEEGSTPAFNLLVRGVARLAEAPDPSTAAGIVLSTRLKLLALLGYAPEMAHCALCGREEGPFYGFSPGQGGIVCEPCACDVSLTCFPLSLGAVSTLRTLLANPLAELDSFELDRRAMAEVEQVVVQILAFHGH